MLFAAFAVYYWAVPLWEAGEKEQAVFVAILFTVSAAVTPTVAPKLVHANGAAFAGLLAVCVAFGAVDTIGVSGGFLGLDRDMTQKSFDQAVAAHVKEKADLETELQGYKNEIAKHRSKFGMSGEIRNASSLELLIADPIKERDRVQGELDNLAEPVRDSRFSVELAAALASLIQIALAIGLIALEAARVAKHRRELAAYEAGLEVKRKEKQKKEKAEARKAQPKPFKPTLVAAND